MPGVDAEEMDCHLVTPGMDAEEMDCHLVTAAQGKGDYHPSR